MKAKHLTNAVLIIVLTCLTVWYLSKTQIITMQTLSTVKWTDCIVVVLWVYLCFAFISIIEKTVYSTFCKYPYKTALLTTLYGNLGSSVSPLKSAHFPLKAYAQKTNGLTLTQTLTGVTKCQIIYSSTSILVYGALAVYLLISKEFITVRDLQIPMFLVVGIGFGANLFIFLGLTLVSRYEKLRVAVLNFLAFIIKLFYRKFNKENFIQKKTERLSLFKEQTTVVFSDFKMYVIPAILYAIYMFMSGFAPYVSYLLVSNATFSVSGCFTFYLLSLSSLYVTNVVPIPGGCVVAEFVFSIIFASATSGFLVQTLLVWRLSTYYIPTIINLAVFCFSSLTRTKTG